MGDRRVAYMIRLEADIPDGVEITARELRRRVIHALSPFEWHLREETNWRWYALLEDAPIEAAEEG